MNSEGYLLEMKNALKEVSKLQSSYGALYFQMLTRNTIEI